MNEKEQFGSMYLNIRTALNCVLETFKGLEKIQTGMREPWA